MDEAERDQMLTLFGATLGRAVGDNQANFKAYFRLRQAYEAQVRGEYERAGLRLPRAFWAAFWREVFPLAAPSDPEAFLSLLAAVTTPYDADLDAHIMERHADGGNTILHVYGHSGTGKSSCALGKAHALRPIPAGELHKRLVYQLSNVPAALHAVGPEEWVILDEQTKTAGEGAKTEADEFQNIEEQFRASRKNLLRLSPTEREDNGQGVKLRSFAWSRTLQKTAFLVKVDDRWVGHVTWPFCPPDVYAEYVPLKDAQVERALAAAFHDTGALMRIVNEAADQAPFVRYLTKKGRPKRKDFEAAFKMFYPRSLSTRTRESVVQVAYDVCTAWKTWEGDEFAAQFGIPPSLGLAEIAKKLYPEN